MPEGTGGIGYTESRHGRLPLDETDSRKRLRKANLRKGCTVTDFQYIRSRSRSGMLTLSDVGKLADSIRNGSLAVLPTETGHMLAALATSEKAIEQAFKVKGRTASNVMHVACASLQMAERVGMINKRAIRLLGDLTPG